MGGSKKKSKKKISKKMKAEMDKEASAASAGAGTADMAGLASAAGNAPKPDITGY